MKVTAHHMRPGAEFQFADPPRTKAKAPIIAIHGNEVVATYYVSDLKRLPDEAIVVACWHGQWKTDGFHMTLGDLRAIAVAAAEKGSK